MGTRKGAYVGHTPPQRGDQPPFVRPLNSNHGFNFLSFQDTFLKVKQKDRIIKLTRKAFNFIMAYSMA